MCELKKKMRKITKTEKAQGKGLRRGNREAREASNSDRARLKSKSKSARDSSRK